MFPKRKLLLFSFFVLGIQLSLSQIAEASAELSLSDGVDSVTVTDNGPGDSNLALGRITFIGAVGNFSGTFNFGTTKPFIGSAFQPQLGLLSSGITTGDQGGTLTILFGDTGFGPVTNGSVSAQIGVSTGGQVSFLTFMDGSNLSLGLATPLTTQGPFVGGTFSDNASGNIAFGPNTSLTEEILVTQGANAITGINSTLRITSVLTAPDGGSAFALFGGALVAMEFLRRRLRQRTS